ILTGVFLIVAGFVQLTAWKARHLDHCRGASCGDVARPDTRGAWTHGLRLGLHCGSCCSRLIAAFLAVGVMALRARAPATVVITAERVAPRPEPIARATGAMIVAAGLVAIARASLPL